MTKRPDLDDTWVDDAMKAMVIVLMVVAFGLIGFGLVYSVHALIFEGVLLPPLVALILLTVTVGPVFVILRILRRGKETPR